MRNNQDCSLILFESILQEAAPVKVKMRRRFVEKKEIRRRKEQAQKCKTYLFAARKNACRLFNVILVESECAKLVAELLLGSAAVRIPSVFGVPVDGDVWRNCFGKLLRKVAGNDIVPEYSLAAGRQTGTGNYAHERGLAKTVVAYQRHLVAARNVERNVVQDILYAVVGKRQVLAAEHLYAAGWRLRETKPSGLRITLRQNDTHLINLVDELLLALRLGRLGRRGAKPIHEPLKLFAMVVLIGFCRLQVFETHLAFAQIPIEIALVTRDRLGVDFDDDIGKGLEQVAVMRNEHQRALILLEILLKPFDRRKIQIVGRFVEKKQIRRGRKNAGKLGTHAPTARERLERLVKLLHRKSKTSQRNLDTRFEIVAAHMLKRRLDFAVLLKHILSGVHPGLKRLHLRFEFAETGHATHRILQKRFFRKLRLRILPCGSDGRRTFYYELTVIRGKLVENNLEQRGLSATVWTDNTYTLTLVDTERNVRQHVLVTIMDRYISEIKHGSVILNVAIIP